MDFRIIDRKYEYTPLYYTTPIKVRYFDTDLGSYQIGIGYKDELIKSNGEVYLIEYVVKEAMRTGLHFDEAIEECTWVSLNKLYVK